MWLETFKLIKKTKLTHDIYELIFELENNVKMIYGQFITFILPKLWGRAYSILKLNKKKLTLIIKRREEGRWWSKYICDLEVWAKLKWVWPAWHFVLRKTNKNKIFFWTWTGFVPLYNQIIGSLKIKLDCKLKLIFWLRYKKDIFYLEKLEKLKKENKNFDYLIYLSREKTDFTNYWYTIDFINENNIKAFEEFYICWIHSMIDFSIKMLKELWINDEKIITEKY